MLRLLLLVLLVPAAAAQPDQVVLFPGETGDDLRVSIVTAYKPTTVLSSAASKDRMMDSVWNVEVDGVEGVVGVYTGYFVPFDCNPSCDPNQDVYNNGSGLDQEHIWPRSMGASGQAERDLHHLAPTWTRANSDRGNLPFGEIPDVMTDDWYVENTVSSTIPTENIDAYSERDRNTAFEPREDFKGDVARAMFYFYTMYEAQADDGFFEEQKETLYAWHYADPVDAFEYDRTLTIAGFQGGADRENPFVLDSTLIRRAYFPQAVSAEDAAIAGTGTLTPAYPNPFSSRTALTLRVGEAQAVRVELFDVLGRRVQTLFEGVVAPGSPVEVGVEAGGLPPGLYVVRASGETFRATRRVTLAR